MADARIQQSAGQPTFDVDIDRTRAQYTGVTAADVTNSLVVNLAGLHQVAPVYWLNEKNGVTYPIALQTPQYQIDTLPALQNLPINAAGAPTTVLGGIADIRRTHRDAVVSQYDISSMVEIYATTQGRDLGSVSSDIRKIIAENDKDKPKGAIVALVGQTATMYSAYSGLLLGLLGAVVLVYFVVVINFQSWSDPFVIITALPAAIAGIVWMLFATHTTLSVPALTGAIMCMGVATANSVLVISFAREKLNEIGEVRDASRARGRLRAPAPGDDDGAGHGDRHAADGLGPGRTAECAARPRGDRRPALRHRLHPVLRPGDVQHHSPAPRPEANT